MEVSAVLVVRNLEDIAEQQASRNSSLSSLKASIFPMIMRNTMMETSKEELGKTFLLKKSFVQPMASP